MHDYGRCPMFGHCHCETAVCRTFLPDESCWWYRYFKQRIAEVESKKNKPPEDGKEDL